MEQWRQEEKTEDERAESGKREDNGGEPNTEPNESTDPFVGFQEAFEPPTNALFSHLRIPY